MGHTYYHGAVSSRIKPAISIVNIMEIIARDEMIRTIWLILRFSARTYLACVQGCSVKLNAGLVKVCPQRLPLTLDPLKVALGAQNQVVARMSAEGRSTMFGHQFVVFVHTN